MNSTSICSSNGNTHKPTLFLSYCSKDECIADIIEDTLNSETNNGIMISRYTRVSYRGSFKEFMNSIQSHDYVLAVVSDSYLKSQACMYEVGEIVKDRTYKNKLLFVVLSEDDQKFYPKNYTGFVAAKIYGGANERLAYTSYWQAKYYELEGKIDAVNDRIATLSASKDLKEIERILHYDINEFLEFLTEYNGKSFDELYSNHFSDIIKWMLPNWNPMFAECTDLRTLLSRALYIVCTITKTDYNQIALLARRNNYDTSLMIFADNVASHKQRYSIVLMNGVMGEAFFSGEHKIIENVMEYEKYFPAVSETQSEAVIPINYQGHTIGVINSESEQLAHYSSEMVEKLQKVAYYLSISLNQAGYKKDMLYSGIPYVHSSFLYK